MQEPVISVANLYKKYKVYARKKDIILEALVPKSNKHTYFTAVNNLSFNIYPGESVGIIGCNGAGKSTLLKMITGVVTPTEGKLKTNGRISSLLELGTAFNPELTGLENIYQHGQIFGLTNSEIEEKKQEIIDFADIGDHLYQPVKNYSSGMFARLAFACAINVDPDILIVDEVLSVGDMAFQMKCFKKFEQFKEKKKTILFVSHNVNDILTNCTRVMILQNGSCIFDGDVKDGVDKYKKLMSGIDMDENRNENKSSYNTNELKKDFEINKEMLVYGNDKASIIDYGIFDMTGKPTGSINSDETVKIIMRVKFNEHIDDPIFAIGFKNVKGVELCGVNTFAYKTKTGSFDAGDCAEIEFVQKLPLSTDTYSVSFGCTKFDDSGNLEVFSRHYDAIFLNIASRKNSIGLFDLDSTVTVRR